MAYISVLIQGIITKIWEKTKKKTSLQVLDQIWIKTDGKTRFNFRGFRRVLFKIS